MNEITSNSVQELYEYEKRGYLKEQMKCFYLIDEVESDYEIHYHDFHKIILFMHGEVEYTIEGKSYVLKPNDVVIVNQNEIHKLKINGKQAYERIIFYISPGYLEKFCTEEYDLMQCMITAGSEHSNVIRITDFRQSRLYKIASEIKNSYLNNQKETSAQVDGVSDFAQALYIQLLFLEFMIHLNRAVLGEQTEYVITDICNEKVVEIIKYVNENLQKDLSIDYLAGIFYMSKYHMMRIFREETGYTIGNYISNKRLFYAKDLIIKGYSVMDACFESGFKEHSTFSRAYKKLFHESPGKTRQKKLVDN